MLNKSLSISFHIIDQHARVPSDAPKLSAYLNRDRWDDWGKYCTQFYLTIVDQDRKQNGIGQLKIGQRGLKAHAVSSKLQEGHRKPNVPSSFEQLDDDFFSLGQDDEYYANLSELGDLIRSHP